MLVLQKPGVRGCLDYLTNRQPSPVPFKDVPTAASRPERQLPLKRLL